MLFSWFLKKLPGQFYFVWHQADTRKPLYLCEMDAEIFYSKGLSCTETFHAERTKPLDTLPLSKTLAQIVPPCFEPHI